MVPGPLKCAKWPVRGVFCCNIATERHTVERPFGKLIAANCQLESKVKKDKPTRDGAVSGLVIRGTYVSRRFSYVSDPAAALERFRSCFSWKFLYL